MKTIIFISIVFFTFWGMSCSYETATNNYPNEISGVSSLVNLSNSAGKKELNLKFYYSGLDSLFDDDNSRLPKEVIRERLEEDVLVLNNYINKLGLNYEFSISGLLKIDNWMGLNSLDAIMGRPNYPDNEIPIFLDSKWHNLIPNSFRPAKEGAGKGYLFIRINEFGNLPVLLHEIFHFLANDLHNHVVPGSSNLCSYLPLHISENFLEICEDFGQQGLVANCFNVMTPRYTLPLMVFMTEQQVNWLNDPTCVGETSMDQVCDFNRPSGWKNKILQEGIQLNDCCVVAEFDEADLNNFLNNTPADVTQILNISNKIRLLLQCARDFPTNSTAVTTFVSGNNNLNIDKPNLIYEDLEREIMNLEPELRSQHIGSEKLESEIDLRIWETNFKIAKGFVKYWLLKFDGYDRMLELEIALMVEGLADQDNIANRLLSRRLAIRDSISKHTQNQFLNGVRLMDISTGFSNQWNTFQPDIDDGDRKSAELVDNFAVSGRWAKMNGAKWISYNKSGKHNPSGCVAKECGDCKSYTLEHCFEVTEDGQVNIEMKYALDDLGIAQLIDENGKKITLWSHCSYIGDQNYFGKTQNFKRELFLKNGSYCLQVEIFNNYNPTGFILNGYLEGVHINKKQNVLR